jgi:hypothetical protein
LNYKAEQNKHIMMIDKLNNDHHQMILHTHKKNVQLITIVRL